MELPNIGQTVKFRNVDYKLVSCNFGGKCTIKKLILPNKGKVLKDIDISELQFDSPKNSPMANSKHTKGKVYADGFVIDSTSFEICTILPSKDEDENEISVQEMEANAARIVECWNNYDEVVTELRAAYVSLQEAANKSIEFAVRTDMQRAGIRNLLSKVLQIDPQKLQETIEDEAAFRK